MKVVADSAIPFLKGVLEPFADVRYVAGTLISAADVRDADALLVRTRTHVDRQLLENSPVKFVATATIGTDHLDKKFLDAQKIFWMNAPGCNAASVAQYVASALMKLSLKFKEPLRGKTLGIVGVGHVGREVLRVAKALGLNVLPSDPPRARDESSDEFVSLETVLQKSDIVTLHVPLERSGEFPTFHLADETFFKKIRSSAWFLNASRGEVVKTAALKNALAKKQIRAAVLDVWENEPNIDAELLRMVDFGTPHIAGYSRDGKANATTQIVRGLARFFSIEQLLEFKAEPSESLPPILYDESGHDNDDCVRDLILKTYDIDRDSTNLKRNISDFESLRNHYPARREPCAYSICMRYNRFELRHMLEALDFTVVED